MWFWLRILLWALLSLVLLVFAVYNRGPVSLSLFPLPWLLDVPLYALALGCFGLGFICSALSGLSHRIRLRMQQHQSRQRAAALEMELKALRIEQHLKHDPTH